MALCNLSELTAPVSELMPHLKSVRELHLLPPPLSAAVGCGAEAHKTVTTTARATSAALGERSKG